MRAFAGRLAASAALAALLAFGSPGPAGAKVPAHKKNAGPRDRSLWPLGLADARLVRAGWGYDARAQAWVPQVELRFVNRDLKRPFRRPVRVEFIPASGRPWVWKTFVALAPGTAQHRRINADGRLDFRGLLPECPAVGLRVDLRPGDPRDGVQPLPRIALADPEAPPAGVPLYVAAVEPGGVLRLLDGRRVAPIGVRSSGPQARAAASWVRARVMDAPVTLEYDSVPPDRGGLWRAYVRLPDGGDLGRDLLKLRLGSFDGGRPFAREASYRAAARPSASRRASK